MIWEINQSKQVRGVPMAMQEGSDKWGQVKKEVENRIPGKSGNDRRLPEKATQLNASLPCSRVPRLH